MHDPKHCAWYVDRHAQHLEVKKKTGEVMLTAKAWNGRVICQWLSEVMSKAIAQLAVGHDDGRYTLACHAAILAWLICQFFGS